MNRKKIEIWNVSQEIFDFYRQTLQIQKIYFAVSHLKRISLEKKSKSGTNRDQFITVCSFMSSHFRALWIQVTYLKKLIESPICLTAMKNVWLYLTLLSDLCWQFGCVVDLNRQNVIVKHVTVTCILFL